MALESLTCETRSAGVPGAMVVDGASPWRLVEMLLSWHWRLLWHETISGPLLLRQCYSATHFSSTLIAMQIENVSEYKLTVQPSSRCFWAKSRL